MRRNLLMIGAFIGTCLLIEVVGQFVALFLGLNTDTGNGGGPGKAGNTPATLVIGIVALALAVYAVLRVARGTEPISRSPTRIIEAQSKATSAPQALARPPERHRADTTDSRKPHEPQSPIIDPADDPHRKALHELIADGMYIYQNIFPEDEQRTGITREKWLESEPEIKVFLTWYRSEDALTIRRRSGEYLPTVIDAYLTYHATVSSPAATLPPLATIEQVHALWPRIRQEVAALNRQVDALLFSVRPYRVAEDTLTIVATYDMHRSHLLKDDSRKVIEAALLQVLSHPYRVLCITEHEARSDSAMATMAVPAPDLPAMTSLSTPVSNATSGAEVLPVSLPDSAADGPPDWLADLHSGEETEDEDGPELMQLIYADPAIQALKRQLDAELREYDDLRYEGYFSDDEVWSNFVKTHPTFAGYLRYYRQNQHGDMPGANAWTYEQGVIEQYYLYCWI